MLAFSLFLLCLESLPLSTGDTLHVAKWPQIKGDHGDRHGECCQGLVTRCGVDEGGDSQGLG